MDLVSKILELKERKKAVILAHNYQLPEVQDIADFIGDSLELSRKAASLSDIKIIVFCGVRFMAETAKVLRPDVKVLLPSQSAGCFLADTISADDVKMLREKFPKAVFVAYVNTTAQVKAEVDICCTSANAVKVVERVGKDKQVVFLPDRNLGNYVKSVLKKANIVLWESGYCNVHQWIEVDDVKKMKELYPKAKVVSHPECRLEVLEMSDMIASTSGMIRYAQESQANEFIICTEKAMCYRLSKVINNKMFYPVSDRIVCETMKKITLQGIYESLKEEIYEVELDDDIVRKARNSIDRMLEVL